MLTLNISKNKSRARCSEGCTNSFTLPNLRGFSFSRDRDNLKTVEIQTDFFYDVAGAFSSVVERFVHIEEVAGPIPATPTGFNIKITPLQRGNFYTVKRLLQLDRCTGRDQLLLDLFRLFFLYVLLDGLRSAIDEIFRLLETQGRHFANNLDDVQLAFAG